MSAATTGSPASAINHYYLGRIIYLNKAKQENTSQAARKRPQVPQTKNTAPAQIEQNDKKAKQKAYLLIASVFAAVLVIVGIFYYQVDVAPFRQVVITVDGKNVRMDYFLTRIRMAQADPLSVLQQLTNELIIKEEAPKLGITVTDKDIETELRSEAAGADSAPVSDTAFKDWYRQRLNQAKVSDATFKEITGTGLLSSRMQDYQAERINTAVPQVHLSIIIVNSEDDATKAIARWNSGEDFAKIAKDVSTDTTSRDKGGDIGWVPRGVTVFDAAAFALDVGKISDPGAYMPDPNSPPSFYYVLLVTEKSATRQVDDQFLPTLKDQALGTWLTAEMKQHTINWNFNSDIASWINHQLAKSQPASNPTPTPGGQR
jgi:foldase protein PrsA